MSEAVGLNGIGAAIAAFARGELLVVSDDEERENEADLVLGAAYADPAKVGFMIRHTGGLLCVPMIEERAAELGLPPMVEENGDAHGTAFTVSVDHESAGTGISADDRAATVRALADPTQPAEAFRRPGHVFPLVARRGGVLKRAGHTEAAVDLAALAGTKKVALISELMDDVGQPLSRDGARRFASDHGLTYLTIADLQRHRRSREILVRRGGESFVPTEYGNFRAVAYRSTIDDIEHLALTLGDVSHRDDGRPALTRVHSECLTGDVIGSRRCDCGEQLRQAMEMIGAEGRGVVAYLRGHEGRGIGLSHKLRAYRLQDQGLDTVEANLRLGMPVDSREYGVGAQILADLGVRRIRLLTNNPAKYTGLAGHGLDIVERISIRTEATTANLRYLAAKQARMGHDLGLEVADPPLAAARSSQANQ